MMMIESTIVLVIPIALCTAVPETGGRVIELNPPTWNTTISISFEDSIRNVYQAAQEWHTFYEAVDRRRALWVENWTNAVIPEELAARAQAAGAWRILVITEPGCSDSANSVPYIAKLVEMTPGLELRLVNSRAGRPWMEAHRTSDGRAATPTVLVLDHEYRIRGCWIEQPAELQSFWLPVVARGAMAEKVDEKMAWYARDKGRETLREIIEVLEGARNGEPICPGLRKN